MGCWNRHTGSVGLQKLPNRRASHFDCCAVSTGLAGVVGGTFEICLLQKSLSYRVGIDHLVPLLATQQCLQ